MRRSGREAVRAATVTPATILGALTVEWFDARYGVTLVSGDVDSWAGRMGLITVQPPTSAHRPDFGTDGGNFLGKSVVQIDGPANRALGRDIGADIFATSSLPYMAIVGRLRTAYTTTANKFMLAVREATQAGNAQLAIYPGAADGQARTFAFGSGNSGSVALDTSVHFIEAYYTAAGESRFALDGTDGAAGSAGGSCTVSHSIGIGAIDQSGNSGDELNVAAVILATALPAAGVRAALRGWAQTNWGAP